MSGPIAGEPFWPWAGARVSAGDVLSNPGEDAWYGVVVTDDTGLIPSSNIIPSGGTFKLKLMVRTAQPGPAFALSGSETVTFYVHELDGTAHGPYAGPVFATTPTPVGDHGPDDVPDTIQWYQSTTAAPITLGDGVYRITAVASDPAPGSGLFVYHDGTIVMVG